MDRAQCDAHDRNDTRKCLVVESARGGVDVALSLRHDSVALERTDELYAAVRGTMVMEYGSPLHESGRAIDALTASIVTARGTNGACAGWNPPEPELLREAGRELQRNPHRLSEVLECAHEIEQIVYPPWPGREHLLERDAGPELLHQPEPPTPPAPGDIFRWCSPSRPPRDGQVSRASAARRWPCSAFRSS